RHPQLLLMGCLCLFTQPFVIALSMGLRVFHNRVSIFNADRITQTPNRPCTSPEIPEFPVAVHIDRTPYDVVMNMFLIDMSTNDKSMIPLCKSPGKFHSQPVRLFRRTLSRYQALAYMLGT